MLTYYNNFVPLAQLKTINMPRQARKTSGTGIYHVMLRGINRQDIFEDDEDYRSENRPLIYCSDLREECRRESISITHQRNVKHETNINNNSLGIDMHNRQCPEH